MKPVHFTLSLLLCACVVPAQAGTVSGTVELIEQIIGTEENGGKPFMLVRVIGTVSSPSPACNSSNRFAIDLSSTSGQEAARIAQLLYVTRRQGRISGNGTCDLYSNSETANEVDAY